MKEGQFLLALVLLCGLSIGVCMVGMEVRHVRQALKQVNNEAVLMNLELMQIRGALTGQDHDAMRAQARSATPPAEARD